MGGDFWDNAAIIILEAESEDTARQIVADDPAVKAYVFQAQGRPFIAHFPTDKFGELRP